jgi:hypothetical protein
MIVTSHATNSSNFGIPIFSLPVPVAPSERKMREVQDTPRPCPDDISPGILSAVAIALAAVVMSSSHRKDPQITLYFGALWG